MQLTVAAERQERSAQTHHAARRRLCVPPAAHDLTDRADETKSRLICLAAAEPDSIFFPDAIGQASREESDSLVQEMLGDVLADTSQPYRPNVSAYSATAGVGAFAANDAPIQPRLLREAPAESAEASLHPSVMSTPAFLELAIFSGKDERFSYQRAVSRIYELDSLDYHLNAKHRPLPATARTWERSSASADKSPTIASQPSDRAGGVEVGGLSDIEVGAIKPKTRVPKIDPMADIDPYALDPPILSNAHAWGVVSTWGEKAGRWGRGAKAFVQGKDDATDRK